MKTSCVIHPDSEPMIIVRKWQLDFCDGNRPAAALLSFFEYWHNIKLEQSKKAKFQNNISCVNGDAGIQDESLYQFHTTEELEAGVLLYSKDAINTGLKVLVDKKVISIHKNPNPKYSFDKTRYFLFVPEVVNAWLMSNRINQNKTINAGSHIVSGNPLTIGGNPTTVVGKSAHRHTENRRAITEITTKITPESINNKSDHSILETISEFGGKPTFVKNNEPVFDYTDFDELQITAVNNWFTYRKEAKKTYKTKSSLTALRNKMLELKASGLLIEAINHSIAMEYTGLFSPNSNRYANSGSSPKKTFNCVHDYTVNKPLKQVDTL